MPTINHEAPIELIREHPALAAEIAQRVAHVPLPERVTVTLGSADASNVVPKPYAADIVAMIADEATSEPVMAVIVEVQGKMKTDKRYAWPSYVTNLRQANKCPAAVLIVVCWDETEAEKCRQPISTGHPGFVLHPIVIGPRSCPDLDGADPWLILLAYTAGAIDIETDHGCQMVFDAAHATRLDTPRMRSLFTLILGRARSDAARKKMEALMTTSPFRSEFLDRIEAEAAAQAAAGAEVRSKVEDIIKVLEARSVLLTGEQREQITSCTDPYQLGRWLVRAATATTAEDVFKD